MEDILNRKSLVLNKSWVVIKPTTIRNAITLMSRDSARGVCNKTYGAYTWEEWISGENPPEVDFYINTPSIKIPAPQIIILNKYNETFQSKVKFSQRAVYKRDDYTCQYCNKKFTGSELSIDHVIPRSKNGPSNFLNCVTSCTPCNNKKSNHLLQDVGMVLIKKPEIPKWNPVSHVTNKPASWEPLLKGNRNITI